jgi:CRP/FNR family cyclic AMP-dependent transcriptional regulator
MMDALGPDEQTLTLIEKTAFLKSVDMFAHIPTEALAQMAARVREMHFDPGATIFKEGDANQGAFLVVDGLVEIHKGRALDGVRGPGIGFGELALQEGEPHNFSAIAAQHTHVLNVSSDDFFETMFDYPEVAVAMVRSLAKRITELISRVHDLEGQIAHLNAALRDSGVDTPPIYQSGSYPRPKR